jgi:hypothetical protein
MRPAAPPVGFQNSATDVDLVFYAARSYSLMRPPRTGRRLICFWERSAAGWPGRAKLAASVRSSSVVVLGILGEDRPQVAFTEDQHAVGDLGPGCEDEPFGVGVRPRASGRDPHRLDTGTGQDRVERFGERPGPVPDREPEAGGAITQLHQQVADLLGGPRPVRVRGDPEDVHALRTQWHTSASQGPLARSATSGSTILKLVLVAGYRRKPRCSSRCCIFPKFSNHADGL